MNMKKYSTAPAQGFTLVELIVVIVILAILATIAFLSFGSQSAAARDSKRKTDLSNIASKMNIAMAQGTTVLNLVGTTGTQKLSNISLAGTGSVGVGNQYNAWDINFNVLGVNSNDFKDANNTNTYKIGATSLDWGAFQLVATLENDNAGNTSRNALVVGNFSQRTTTNSTWAVTIASGAKTISLAGTQVGLFKKNDTLKVGAETITVSNVSSDLATITLGTGTTASATTVSIAQDESAWLVASGSVDTAAVEAGKSACPY